MGGSAAAAASHPPTARVGRLGSFAARSVAFPAVGAGSRAALPRLLRSLLLPPLHLPLLPLRRALLHSLPLPAMAAAGRRRPYRGSLALSTSATPRRPASCWPSRRPSARLRIAVFPPRLHRCLRVTPASSLGETSQLLTPLPPGPPLSPALRPRLSSPPPAPPATRAPAPLQAP